MRVRHRIDVFVLGIHRETMSGTVENIRTMLFWTPTESRLLRSERVMPSTSPGTPPRRRSLRDTRACCIAWVIHVQKQFELPLSAGSGFRLALELARRPAAGRTCYPHLHSYLGSAPIVFFSGMRYMLYAPMGTSAPATESGACVNKIIGEPPGLHTISLGLMLADKFATVVPHADLPAVIKSAGGSVSF
jgi:hypothetical protein